MIAGPCAVESEAQILKTAKAVKAAGADFLRGGAFKPRTGPHTFQGLKEEGLRLLDLAKQETGLPIVTEVMTSENVELVSKSTDILQVGARNMQNFDLLRELGRIRKPVLLKRGMSATIEEFLAAAEYILAEGNPMSSCASGASALLKQRRVTAWIYPSFPSSKNCPICRLWSIRPMPRGSGTSYHRWPRRALVAGVHGIMVEVHPEPEKALSDGPQSLTIPGFEKLMEDIKRIREFLDSPAK